VKTDTLPCTRLSTTKVRPVAREASAMKARNVASRKLITCCAERLVEASASAAKPTRKRFIGLAP
jgi:hypothetical protein